MLDKKFYDLKWGQHIMTIPKTGYYKARISKKKTRLWKLNKNPKK